MIESAYMDPRTMDYSNTNCVTSRGFSVPQIGPVIRCHRLTGGFGVGGWGGIRTHEELAPLPVFKTGAFNRSATHPCLRKQAVSKTR